MSQITRVPWGLQDFLGNQSQGDNPSEFAQIVAPVLDLSQFYSIEKEKHYTEGFGIISTNATIDVEVPEGEVWIIKSIGARHAFGTAPTAGDGYTMCYFATNLTNSNIPTNLHGLRDDFRWETDGVAGGSVVEAQPVHDFIAWAGTLIKWRVTDVVLTSGNFSPAGFVRYLKLEI